MRRALGEIESGIILKLRISLELWTFSKEEKSLGLSKRMERSEMT
tara:strand:- start:1982 stop:2116 length:135 start_codon:yes stop_codon:yes gene_type:complete